MNIDSQPKSVKGGKSTEDVTASLHQHADNFSLQKKKHADNFIRSHICTAKGKGSHLFL
jgi:hypothetical protein